LILNLKNLKNYNNVKTKVCIIGAGTTGIFLSHQLRLNNIPVIILEAGNEVNQTPNEYKLFCQYKNSYYRGADLGRSVGLGGTSNLWSGQMIRFSKNEFNPNDGSGNLDNLRRWPIKFKEMEKYYKTVEKILGLNFYKAKYKKHDILPKFFNVRYSAYLSKEKKNFFKFFSTFINNDDDLKVYTNAPVVHIENKKENSKIKKISRVISKNANGNIIDCEAEIVIICAGALESFKLLSIYDKKNKNCITKTFSGGKLLGKYFSDQFASPCAEFILENWKKFNLNFSPFYEKKTLNYPRFELSTSVKKKNVPNVYFSFIFSSDNSGYIDKLKILLKKKSRIKLFKFFFRNCHKIIYDSYNYFISRFFHKIAWFYKSSKMLLIVWVEQLPDIRNNLSISKNNLNFINKKLIINWSLRKKDYNFVESISDIFIKNWNNSKCREIAYLKKLNYSFDPVYHPSGTIRIGSSSKDSIVNKNLKLWSVKNCYICSTSVFPTPAISNTGLTLLALSLRLSNYLNKIIKS
jgi:hypothetical protein